MDVDNGPYGQNPQNGGDIEQSLLQQFSCMGTTDRDELVSQLQKLLGNNLNEATASFFLDMNNWNLQAAIGSYFDCDVPFKLPQMCLIGDFTIGEGESITPRTRFIKTWRVQNNGDENWPYESSLLLTGPTDLQCAETRIPVPPLAPGAVHDISIELQSPENCGVVQSKWRLCTKTGSYFGDALWAIVSVTEDGTMALTQQLAHLSTASGGSGMNVDPQHFNVASQSAIPMPDVPGRQSVAVQATDDSVMGPFYQNSHQQDHNSDDSNMC